MISAVGNVILVFMLLALTILIAAGSVLLTLSVLIFTQV